MQSGLVDANITNINGSTWQANYTYKKDGNIEQKTTNGNAKSYEYDTTAGGSVFDSDIMTKAGDDDLAWNPNGRLAGLSVRIRLRKPARKGQQGRKLTCRLYL
jgi:hypothetical protein